MSRSDLGSLSNFALQWAKADPSSQYTSQPRQQFQSPYSLPSATQTFQTSEGALQQVQPWVAHHSQTQPRIPQNNNLTMMNAPISARVLQTTEDADAAMRIQMLTMLRQAPHNQGQHTSFQSVATFQQRPSAFPLTDQWNGQKQVASSYQLLEQSFLAQQYQQQQQQQFPHQSQQPWLPQYPQHPQTQHFQVQQPLQFQSPKQFPPQFPHQVRQTSIDSNNDFAQLTPLERSMLADSPLSYHTQVSTPAMYAQPQDPSPYSSHSVPSSSSSNSHGFKLPLLCGSSSAQAEPLAMLPPTLPVDPSAYAYASAAAMPPHQRSEVSPAQTFGPNPFASDYSARPFVQVATESGIQTFHSAVTPSDILFESTLAYRTQSHGSFPTSVGSLSSFAPLDQHSRDPAADGVSVRLNEKPMDSFDNDTGSSASCTDLLSNLTEVTASPSPKSQTAAVRPKASRIPSDSSSRPLSLKVESSAHSPIPTLPLPSPTTSVNSVGKSSSRTAVSKKAGSKSPKPSSSIVSVKVETAEKKTPAPAPARPKPSPASSITASSSVTPSSRTRSSARVTPSRSAKRKLDSSDEDIEDALMAEAEEEEEEQEDAESNDEEYDEDSDEEYDDDDSDLDSPAKKKKPKSSKRSSKKGAGSAPKTAKSAASAVAEDEDEDAYHSAIVCGHSQPDLDVEPADELVATHFSAFFNKVVPVYTASNDADKRVLYRARDLATHMNCDVSNLCMFLKRLPNKIELGVYQATAIQDKYDCNPGLKKGAYFVTREVCEKFASRRVHKRHSKPRSSSKGARRKAARGSKGKSKAKRS